jgi:methionine biosynthesis protein MetW
MTTSNGPPALGSDQAFYEAKASVYGQAYNKVALKQVLRCLPEGGSVLDVGCGSGLLLGKLARRAGHLAGVELSATAAAAAAEVAHEIVNAPIDADLPFTPGTFDVVVCADILEHLPDPVTALAGIARYCRPGGAVVISVPNVANWESRLRLLRGIWRYEQIGLFDAGHLRFFTRATLLAMIGASGLHVESCVSARVPRLTLQVPPLGRLPAPLPLLLNKGWAGVGYGLARLWPTLLAYQLVCTARRPASQEP